MSRQDASLPATAHVIPITEDIEDLGKTIFETAHRPLYDTRVSAEIRCRHIVGIETRLLQKMALQVRAEGRTPPYPKYMGQQKNLLTRFSISSSTRSSLTHPE
jgi:hypothetical protein